MIQQQRTVILQAEFTFLNAVGAGTVDSTSYISHNLLSYGQLENALKFMSLLKCRVKCILFKRHTLAALMKNLRASNANADYTLAFASMG